MLVRSLGKAPILSRILLGVLLVVILLVSSSLGLAQGPITYGSSVVGSLSAEAPLGFHVFTGNAGDQINLLAVGITPNMAPAISLLGPDQQQLSSSSSDPFGTAGEVRISYRLQTAGLYTMLITNAASVPGDYLLRLNGRPAVPGTTVSDQAAAVVEVAPQSPVQVFAFAANPGASTIVTVATNSPGFEFAVQWLDPSGQVAGTQSGSASQQVSLMVGPGEGVYEAHVASLTPDVPGAVTVSLGLGSTPSVQAPAPPVATEEVAPPQPSGASAPAGVCSVNTDGVVNLRSGPGTDYSIIGQLTAGNYLVITGMSGDGTWYMGDYFGQQAWVFTGVVGINGPCSGLPVVQTSAQPSQPSAPPTATTASSQPRQATPTYTYTPTQQVQQPQQTEGATGPTATATPSYTPTTPPAAQVAPEDARFNNPLNIPLDNTASVLDFVSYPGGDTEDRVRWDITGMNPNVAITGGRARLVIQVTCFGEGTNQIQLFTGGQTYACGQTIVDREVTSDSRTGQVTITAVGGSATYVQWVLTGTATRTN